LNKSLVDLIVFPAYSNLSENDPRRRSAIPAYSGNRQVNQIPIRGSIGIEATSLLTLSFLNLLDKGLDAFDTVYITLSTLSWLFEEKQKATYHQPSKIRDAHKILELIAADQLEKLIPSTTPDSDFAEQVGDELALLIAEAEKVRENESTQHIVVKSSPVYRLSSLMEEEVDFSVHAAVLSSCQSVVSYLQHKGQITADEEKRARSYLQFVEKPWTNQPEIEDGAVLYLDDLSVHYLLRAGILNKLRRAGFKPIVSPFVLSEINGFISYERISEEVNEAIERIRSAINVRIESGKIQLGRQSRVDDKEKQSLLEQPTFGIFALAKDCDLVIADDRFFNQRAVIGDDSAQAPIYSTLDLIETLASYGSITLEERSEYITRLRRAGYFFIPASENEFLGYLNNSPIQEGKIHEIAELRAIRENILQVRMSTWLQLPSEIFWLESIFMALIRAMWKLWKTEDDISSIKARSSWILNQVDIRGWAHCFDTKTGDSIIETGRAEYIVRILTPPPDLTPDSKKQYWDCVEEKILDPIKEQYPNLYALIVKWYEEQIVDFVNKYLEKYLEANSV
jgi:hypothetical protein